jgi:polar amino acid transport system substrate-binding protein
MFKIFSLMVSVIALFLFGCGHEKDPSSLTFAVSGDYPPYEYYENGKLVGFDIDLARLIGQELGKSVIFQDMQASTLFASLGSNQIDAAISTLTITEDRAKNFDFSTPYYFEGLAAVFPSDHPILNQDDLKGKKIATQLGSTMEIWLKKNIPDAEIVTVDSNIQGVEALKAHHVDLVFVDGAQAAIFSKKNPSLSYAMITQAEAGYGIALSKNSPLKKEIDEALKQLKEKGEIQKLKEKWLGDKA